MAKNPKPSRLQHRRIRMALKRIDPSWSGKKPRFPRPIQLHDGDGRPVDASELIARGRKIQEELAMAYQGEGQKIMEEHWGEQIACQEPDGPHQRIGWQVEVIDILPTWMYGGGWIDGPFEYHPGARLFLDYAVGGRVYYQGYQRLGLIGWFMEDQLVKVRRLP